LDGQGTKKKKNGESGSGVSFLVNDSGFLIGFVLAGNWK